MATQPAKTEWKPSRDEAEFIGQIFAIDGGLADIVKVQLAKGMPLREVVAGFKSATEIAGLLRGEQVQA